MEDFAVGVLAFREAPLLRLPGERIPFGFARFAFIWLSFYHYVIEHLLFQSPAVKDAPKPCAICLAAKSHLLPIEGGRSSIVVAFDFALPKSLAYLSIEGVLYFLRYARLIEDWSA